MRLVRLARVVARGVKIYAPEVWRGSQKLHPDADASRSAFPGEDDPALLLFLCFGVHQYQHLVVIHFVLQHQQPAVSIHHQRLAYLAKLLARVAAAQSLQLHPVKDALAAPVGGKGGFLHSVPIIGLAPESVNCPFGQVFPIAKLFLPRSACKPQSAGRRILRRLRLQAGRIQDQTAVAFFFIIFEPLVGGIESLSLRLGASYEPC